MSSKSHQKSNTQELNSTAGALLGHYRAGCLTQRERDDLWKLFTSSGPVTAACRTTLATIADKLEGRRQVA